MSPSSLRFRAYENIQRRILTGEIPPGSVLSELTLARELGMSRSPVREAIRTLEQEGVVEQKPRFGTIVRTLERRDLVELYELREAIEPYAVARAAGEVLPEDLLTLHQLCDEIGVLMGELEAADTGALDERQLRRLLSADLGFHLVLLRAVGNQRMMKIVSDSRLLTGIFGSQRQPHTRAVIEETHRFHRSILDAVERGDGEAARGLMAEHIAISKRETLEAYDRLRHRENPRHLPHGIPKDLLADIERIENRRAPRG